MNHPEPALETQWQQVLSHLGVKKRSRRKESLLANQEEKVIPTATSRYRLVWTRTAIPSRLFMKWEIPEYTPHTHKGMNGFHWLLIHAFLYLMLRRSATLGKVGTRREAGMLGAMPVGENEAGTRKGRVIRLPCTPHPREGRQVEAS